MRIPFRKLLFVMIGRSLAASNPIRALAGRVGGVISIAIGIVSILLGLIPCINILAIFSSIIGIAIGALAYRQARLAFAPTRYAVFGIVFSFLALMVAVGVSRSLYNKYYGQEEPKSTLPQNNDTTATW